MEKGEKFEFEKFKWHGVERAYPVHPEHLVSEKMKKDLIEVIEQAAINGHDNPEHHIESEGFVADLSLIDELKKAIERGETYGYTYVTHGWLKSLIRKHEVQVPGTVEDIAKQPGEWQIRGGNVEAIQHEGGERGARVIRAWIEARGGVASYLGTWDQEVDHTRLRLNSPREPNIVNSGWWVIKTADGIFYTMPDSDFHIVYVPRKKEQTDGSV